MKKKKSVKIQGPKGSDFSLPDEGETATIFKQGDFNADGKKDIMVHLGACGTGGCMYALFLNHSVRKYTLAFNDYLKNPEIKTEKNAVWFIKSYEELEPYNPSKLSVSVYKYNVKTNTYELYKIFVQQNQ